MTRKHPYTAEAKEGGNEGSKQILNASVPPESIPGRIARIISTQKRTANNISIKTNAADRPTGIGRPQVTAAIARD